MATPETPKKWYQQFDYKDALAVVGLGLLGWGLHRIGGRTFLILFLAFIALAWSGLVHLVVQYVESHVVGSLRAVLHPDPQVDAPKKNEVTVRVKGE
jgi:hypothetical protein